MIGSGSVGDIKSRERVADLDGHLRERHGGRED